MNYLVAVDRFHLDLPGGAYKIAWKIACKMRSEGHQVAILCIGDRAKPASEECQGIRIVRYIPRWGMNILKKVKNHIESACVTAKRHLGFCKWDIIHAHTPLPGLGALKAFGTDTRTVYTIHSPVVLEQRINWGSQGLAGWLKLVLGMGALKRLEAQAYNSFAVLQSLSNFTKSQIHRLYGVGDKIRVIPFWSAYDGGRQYEKSEARKKLGWPGKAPLLFSLRRMTSRMGLADAIAAAGRLANECDFHLVLAGDGPLRGKLEQQAEEASLADRVIFTGRLSDEQVALAYQAADLFLLPTRSLECFGIIILEAYSFGCPVLSSDAGAIPELVRPICKDFIFPAGNVETLTKKLASFLRGDLIAPTSQDLLSYVKNNYSRDVLYPRWREMILGE